MFLVEGLCLPWVDALPIQKLGRSVLIVRVSRLLILLRLERRALLLVERKRLLQPPESTTFLLQSPRAPRLLRHCCHIAQHAHAHC